MFAYFDGAAADISDCGSVLAADTFNGSLGDVGNVVVDAVVCSSEVVGEVVDGAVNCTVPDTDGEDVSEPAPLLVG